MLPAGYAAAYKKQMLQPSTATSASYIAIIQFLLALAKEKAIPITLFMAYCAMESGSFHIIFGSYSVFRGAFNAQDYYHIFPQNIMCMVIAMPVLYTVVYFLNKKR